MDDFVTGSQGDEHSIAKKQQSMRNNNMIYLKPSFLETFRNFLFIVGLPVFILSPFNSAAQKDDLTTKSSHAKKLFYNATEAYDMNNFQKVRWCFGNIFN